MFPECVFPFVCFQNEKRPRPQASQPCSCPHIIRLLSQDEGVFAQELEPAPIEDGIVYPEPSDSPTLDTRQGSCRLLGPCTTRLFFPSLRGFCIWVGGWPQALRACPPLPHPQSCSRVGQKEGRDPVGLLLTIAHCLLFPLLAFLAVSSRCRHQPEGPWEECTPAAGAQRSTALTVPAPWTSAAVAFPALSIPMKVGLQP